MDLENNRHYKISKNAADPNDTNLYMLPTSTDDPKAFKVSKAGEYFYLRMKHILEKLKIDYKANRVIFDIKEEESNGTKYYKLEMRPLKKKS